jgi:hypothetical protein
MTELSTQLVDMTGNPRHLHSAPNNPARRSLASLRVDSLCDDDHIQPFNSHHWVNSSSVFRTVAIVDLEEGALIPRLHLPRQSRCHSHRGGSLLPVQTKLSTHMTPLESTHINADTL